MLLYPSEEVDHHSENQWTRDNFELGKIMEIIDIFFQLWRGYFFCAISLESVYFVGWIPEHFDMASCRFHLGISVTVTTLRKLASIIYSDGNCFGFERRNGTYKCECVKHPSVSLWQNCVFSVVIIVSINLYWQLGEFVNFLVALSSVLKDKPIEWEWDAERERKAATKEKAMTHFSAHRTRCKNQIKQISHRLHALSLYSTFHLKKAFEAQLIQMSSVHKNCSECHGIHSHLFQFPIRIPPCANVSLYRDQFFCCC